MKTNHCPTCKADLPPSHRLNLCKCGLIREKLGYHSCRKPFGFTTKKMEFEQTFKLLGVTMNIHPEVIDEFILITSQSILQAQEQHNEDCTREEWAREAQKEQTRKEIVEKIENYKRFKCGACESSISNLSHTQFCLFRKDIIELLINN